jgi:transposase
MPKYIPYDLNQNSMVVINFSEQLQAGTFEHAIAYLIDERLDLSLFAERIKNDDGGRPAYDPAIMLKIILFAYSKGITSSREIQWCCQHNIIFKALSCDSEPHFTSIASFVSSHAKAIEDLFEQILLICDEQGLIGNELFATDGCKLPSNAAKEWSGTFKELKAKRKKYKKLIRLHLKEHQTLDSNEPKDMERAKRLEQSIETLDSAYKKVDNFLKTQSPRIGRGKRAQGRCFAPAKPAFPTSL